MTDSIFISLVKDSMHRKGINSEALAAMTGMNHAALNMILTERVRTTLGVGLKLSQVLNISIDQITTIEKRAAGLN